MIYIDPSGHFLQCAWRSKELGHVCWDDGYSIDNPNPAMVSDDAEARRNALLAYNNSLAAWAAAGWLTDLEALAQLAEYGASLIPVVPASVRGIYGEPIDLIRAHTLIDDLYSILVISAPPLVQGGELEAEATNFGQSGYAWIFQDPLVGFNQANHFWYYVWHGSRVAAIGSIGNYMHETMLSNDMKSRSYQDYALGNEGLALGKALSRRGIPIGEVGNYIRNNLGPSSPKIDYWTSAAGSTERKAFYFLSVMFNDIIRSVR